MGGGDYKLDKGDLCNFHSILLGSSDGHPLDVLDWDVVSEVLLPVATY